MKEASLSIVEDVENGRYLMIRNHRGINKGCLNFPGGKKEPGEDMRACVIRETFEETGITVKNPVEVGFRPWIFTFMFSKARSFRES